MANTITTENAKAGTSSWQLSNPAINREIEGYCGAASVNRGGSITWHVNCAASYEARVYRMGYYGGLRGRQVAGPLSFSASPQPMPVPKVPTSGPTQPQHRIVECDWSVTHTLSVPANDNWPSGIYLVKLTVTSGANTGKDCYMIFCVRDDSRAADIVYTQPTNTYHAYNAWGGKNLYTHAVGDNLAKYGITYGFATQGRKVSYNRPYTTYHATGYTESTGRYESAKWGIGAGEFLAMCGPNSGTDYMSGWESDLVAWLEREGYDVKYVTNVDQHTGGVSLFAGARTVLSVGHDEYHTQEMRDALVQWRDQGGHLCVFGANFSYWRVRLEPHQDGAANRTIVCYKNNADKEDPGTPSTKQFRQVGQPEEMLGGVQYLSYGVSRAMFVETPTHWVWEGAGVTKRGDSVGSHLIGYEWDTIQFPDAIPGRVRLTYGGGDSAAVIYQAPSGAWVFSTGSMQFSWGLESHDYLVPNLRPSTATTIANGRPAIMVRNVLAAQGVVPGEGGGGGPPPDPDPDPVSIVVSDLRFRRAGTTTWTNLPTQPEGDTSYTHDVSGLSGTTKAPVTYEWEVRARDTADNAASVWVRRTIVVANPVEEEPPPPPPTGAWFAVDGVTYLVIGDAVRELAPEAASGESVRAWDGTMLSTATGEVRAWTMTLYDLTPAEDAVLRAAIRRGRRVPVGGVFFSYAGLETGFVATVTLDSDAIERQPDGSHKRVPVVTVREVEGR